MKHLLVPGLSLGALLAGWMYVVGFMGWYKHETLHLLFWVVVPIQGAVLWFVLRGAAGEGGGFIGRFARGAGTAAVAAPLVFLNSLLFTQVVFPKYFEELRATQEKILKAKGIPDAEVTELLKAAAAMENPYLQAAFGAIGTVVTGVVLSLILAAMVRKKA